MATIVSTYVDPNDEFKRITVITDTDGSRHRKILRPTDDISSYSDDIKALANSLWTDDIKTAWQNKVNADLAKYGG
tara:strand:+ start:316 stop:543 length:228 start_codon:yes stop_codon:yes gene_type:complete